MSKFLLNEEEKDNIRFIYESHGIILNEDSLFGTIARKAIAWAGKNEDDIIRLFKTSEVALSKSMDDIVSTAAKAKNIAQLDDLQAKLMHFYNPSGQAAGIELAKQNTVKFLNAYSKSKGKTSWREIRNEVSGVAPQINPKPQAKPNPTGSVANKFAGNRVSNRTFEYLKKLDGIYLVEEDKIAYWTFWLAHLLKVYIEPSAAINMDPAINWCSGKVRQKILILLSGGNIDPSIFKTFTSKIIDNSPLEKNE
jgi:hypothetical protein